MNDIDKEISKTEEKIEKLKILKAKQDELKQLESELGVTRGIPTKTKEKKKLPKISISPRTRKVVVSLLICSMLLTVSFLFITRVVAADPVVVYADPDDDSLFADTNDGDGVTWVINVSDADTDIQEVELWGNSSGSWVKFYDSGALGGVAYHNTSDQNGNWTGSWTKYWWNISVNDGTWHNTTYSFTTAYQWGDPQMAHLDDDKSYSMGGVAYKNATGEYYMSLYDATDGDVEIMSSDTGTNWSLQSKTNIDTSPQDDPDMGVWDFFTYNNEPAFFYVDDGDTGYITIAHKSGGSWTTTSTGIVGRGWDSNPIYERALIGTAIHYYNGIWQIVTGRAHPPADDTAYISHYKGTPWNTWTWASDLWEAVMATGSRLISPSLAVLNGTLHCVYRDAGDDLHWQTYDGASWTDRGDIEAIGAGCSLVKDPVNQQVVCTYINSAGNLAYRRTDNLTSWSASHTILSKGAYTIQYPQVKYIDHRLVISFSYNLRGNYNIYTICAPDYSSRPSGVNYTLNRIQWPDASPGDTNVNSTVFSLKNLNNRDIKTITWHFEDIGEIANASNIEMWTNMSGSWASIGTTDANGDISTLDISGEMAGGAEWIPGQTIYWKAEILAVGSVSEDIHTTDEDIFYKITF